MFFLSIIFLPLLGSIFAGLFGKYIGHKGSILISTSTVFLTFLFSLNIFFDLIKYGKNYHITLIQWISSGLFNCNWGFLFDTLTVIMLIVVTSISTLVHIYSANYMSQDPHLSRFMSY